jgi:hypothetical protein
MPRRTACVPVVAFLVLACPACDGDTSNTTTDASDASDSCTPAGPDIADSCPDESLWCGPSSTCEPRAGPDEVCDPRPCLPELTCHIDKRCGVTRQAGEACASSFECTPGLRCNHGELPELFAVGVCREQAADGEPCGYEHAPDEALGRALAPYDERLDRGDCLPGLSCAPGFPAPGGTDAPPICLDSKGVACFFSGSCQPDGALAIGAPCTRSIACASGVCAVFASPLSATPLPGFGKGGEWLGPRVGTCVGADDAITNCGRGDPCAEGFTCIDRECIAPNTQRPGEVCSDAGGHECAFGLVCDGRECRYP